MRLFRQIYRVTHPSGARRLHAVLVEANFAREARLVAFEAIRAEDPDVAIEFHGEPELVELLADWVLGEQVW